VEKLQVNEADLVLIGRIRKAHGLKGEVELVPLTWNENRFSKLARFFLRLKSGEIVERHVQTIHEVHKGLLLKIKEVEDRTEAETLNGAEILIPETERLKLPKGRAYYDEVIGMAVIDDESGTQIGTVKNVVDMPSADIFVLDLNGTEHMVTNAGEEVRALDVKKKELRVRLLEPYEGKAD